VKPYVKTNKSDYIDAEAIGEAVGGRGCDSCRSNRLPVGSTVAASGARALGHATHGGINQTRSLLLERGITLRRGRCHLETALPEIIEDATAKLSGTRCILLTQRSCVSIRWDTDSEGKVNRVYRCRVSISRNAVAPCRVVDTQDCNSSAQ
jgi:hypothetical protein